MYHRATHKKEALKNKPKSLNNRYNISIITIHFVYTSYSFRKKVEQVHASLLYFDYALCLDWNISVNRQIASFRWNLTTRKLALICWKNNNWRKWQVKNNIQNIFNREKKIHTEFKYIMKIFQTEWSFFCQTK